MNNQRTTSPLQNRPRCYAKSPTAQDAYWPIPGLTSAYALLKQKPYNFTTNTLKAYLSAQASSLSAFLISKIHKSGQKPRGRQLNANVCGSKSAILRLLCSDHFSNNDNSKTVQALTLILAQNCCSSQRAASQPLRVLTFSNSPWSIKAIHNTVVAVRC